MRSRLERTLLGGLLSLLCGCSATTAIPPPRIISVAVAVAVGCVVDRPAPPVALNTRVPNDQWDRLAPGAKAQSVLGQAGERLNYQDALAAATSGCKDAPK